MMETYVKIPDRIMRRKKLSPAAKLLYGLLMSLCQSKGYCWATNATLAERLGMGRKSMTRLLGELREHGLIYYDKSGGTGAERNTRRLLRLTEPEETAPEESGDVSGCADADSSGDFNGWLNQCIARMERAKREWAQSHPQQPEHGDSAEPGQEMQVTATPKTAGDAGFGAQEVRSAVVEKVPGNAGFVAPEQQEVCPSAPVKTSSGTGFGVLERQEEQSAVPTKAPAHSVFSVPERQESPKSAQQLTAPQTLPPQTDTVLESWIQVRHRDWSEEDRAQFSGFWQTYWAERQQQGYPYPEKHVRHRFLERVNMLSEGDRATMQDILRHHRIGQ